jgi:hypothetical protein
VRGAFEAPGEGHPPGSMVDTNVKRAPFDPDTIQTDGRGDTPIWTIAAPENVA